MQVCCVCDVCEECSVEGVPWNPSIAATLGEQHFGRYIGVAFIAFFVVVHKLFIWDLGPDRYIAVGLFSGVAVNEGFVSTVVSNSCSSTDSTCRIRMPSSCAYKVSAVIEAYGYSGPECY